MNIKNVRKELGQALLVLLSVKVLSVVVGLTVKPILKWVLSCIYGDAASAALEVFSDSNSLSSVLLNGALTCLCVPVPIAAYFAFSGKSFCRVVPSAKPKFMQICYGVGATVTIGYVSNLLGMFLLRELFDRFGLEDRFESMTQGGTELPTNFWLLLVSVVFLTVVPALSEEFLLRGILLSATKKFGTAFTVFCSGFFFAFLHNTWIQIPFAFVLGMVLAYFTLRFQTVWIAVISHFIFNLNSVAMSLILQHGGRYGEMLALIMFFLVFPLMIGLFVAGAILYGVKKPNLPSSEFKAGQKLGSLFRSPYFWIFLPVTVFQLAVLLCY